MENDANNTRVQRGTIGGHGYVQIGGLKWATNNVAVSDSGYKEWRTEEFEVVKAPGTEEDVIVGDYFQWGAHAGFCGKPTDGDRGLLIYESFTRAICGDELEMFNFKSGRSFQLSNTPYGSGLEYRKYTGTEGDGRAVLEPSDDVASVCWGEGWRTPSSAEYKALYSETEWTWSDEDSGYYVTPKGECLSWDRTNALLFFPASGYGYTKTTYGVGCMGRYWSRDLYPFSQSSSIVYRLSFDRFTVNPQEINSRHGGFSVRAVSDR